MTESVSSQGLRLRRGRWGTADTKVTAALAGLSSLFALTAGLFVSTQADDMKFVEYVSGALFISSMAFIVITAVRTTRAFVHPYVMFLGTFTLFLGGRFVAYLVGFHAPVFGTHWVSDLLSPAEAAQGVAWLLCAAFAIHGGFLTMSLMMPGTREDPGTLSGPGWSASLWLPAVVILGCSAGLAGYGMLDQFAACSRGGYQAIYQSDLDVALRAANAGSYGLLIGTGLAFASRNRAIEIIALVLLGIFFMGYLWIGVRGGILAFLLMLGWVVFHRLSKAWAVGVFLVVVALLFPVSQFASAFGCRSVPAQNLPVQGQTSVSAPRSEIGDVKNRMNLYVTRIGLAHLLAFSHEQGTTMVYTQLARRIPEYPWPAYVQTFVPGFAAAMSLSGRPQKLSDLYFGHHMARELNPEYYGRSQTMGWSLLGDFAVLSGGRVLVYLGLAAVSGALLFCLLRAATLHFLAFGALVCIFPKLMMLPRAGLYSIFPYLFVYFCLVLSWRLFLQLLQLSPIELPQGLRSALGLDSIGSAAEKE